MQDVRSLEGKIYEWFDQELQSWRDSERKLFSLIEERTNGLWNELSKESKTRFDSIEHLKACLENDFPWLQDSIKTEAAEREEADNLILKRVEEEGSKFTDLLED